MGRERLVKIADGLYARYYPSGRRALQVQFFYRGARCRETLKGLDPDNRTHVRMAKHRAGAILEGIRLDTFDYREWFPDSQRGRLFGRPPSRTVKQVGDSWLADMKRSKRDSSYRSYSNRMEHFVYAGLSKGQVKVSAVTPEHIRDLFRSANFTLKTARNYAIPLNAIFERALGDGDIDKNPMDRISLKELIPEERHDAETELDPLSRREIDLFLETCRIHRPGWLQYFTVAFYSGLRTGELYGLQWPDWRGEQLDVRRAIVEGKLSRPKTKKGRRTITLPPIAQQALKAQKQETGLLRFVFWNPTTQKPVTDYRESQHAFDYVCGKAKIRRRNQYQTRHSYASNLFLGGENPLFIMRQLGHKNLLTLYAVYAKWIDDETATYTPRSTYSHANRNG